MYLLCVCSASVDLLNDLLIHIQKVQVEDISRVTVMSALHAV